MKASILSLLLLPVLILSGQDSLKVKIPVQAWDKEIKTGILFENPVPPGKEVQSVILETVFYWPYHEPQDLEGIWILNDKQLLRETLQGERGEWIHRISLTEAEFSSLNNLVFLNPREAWIFLEEIRLYLRLDQGDPAPQGLVAARD